MHPTRQGEGLGGVLIRDSLALAKSGPAAWSRVLLVGDASYYGRFGFQKRADIKMPPPTNPDRVLGLSLTDMAWQGVSGQVTPVNVNRAE